MQRKCHNCGTSYEENALKFCLQCGTELYGITNDSTTPLRQSKSTNPGTSPFPTQQASRDNYLPPQSFGQQANQWQPPPAPVAQWQNQGLGQNTPFASPMIPQGQNQTLPIVSLVFGILSVCCYIGWITGPVALITGYLGMKNIARDPINYGGKGLATAGMIVGGVFSALWLLIILFYVVIIIIAAVGSSVK